MAKKSCDACDFKGWVTCTSQTDRPTDEHRHRCNSATIRLNERMTMMMKLPILTCAEKPEA